MHDTVGAVMIGRHLWEYLQQMRRLEKLKRARVIKANLNMCCHLTVSFSAVFMLS